jgi:hypothetical protein
MAFLFNGLACVSVAIVLWLRSPMRTPVGERVFRAFWLHGPGRLLIRWTMRRTDRERDAGRGTTAVTSPAAVSASLAGNRASAAPVVTPPPRALNADARLDALDARVRALESWRDATRDTSPG